MTKSNETEAFVSFAMIRLSSLSDGTRVLRRPSILLDCVRLGSFRSVWLLRCAIAR
jgi:hypothetical protein